MSEAPARTGPGRRPAAPRPADPVSALVLALRGAGLDPDAENLGDALWLANTLRGPGPEAGDEERGAAARGSGVRPGPVPAPPEATPPGPAGPEAEPDGGTGGPHGLDGADADGTVALYLEPQDTGASATGTAHGPPGPAGRLRGLPVGVPAAPAFGSSLALQRALRPLQGYRTAGTRLRTVLDETATADLSARAGGLILPVYRRVARRDAALHLVLDASPSMRVWDRMFDELARVFGQLGAFKNVVRYFLHEGPGGSPVVGSAPDPQSGPFYSPEHLADPTGRTMTVLVSDCAGPLWRSGRGHRVLHRLAGSGPVVVLQPLPQRLWNRTRLPVVFGDLTRGPFGRVQVAPGGPRPPAPGALPVPVVPPVPAALASWARLMSGGGARAVTGAIGWVRSDQPPSGTPGAPRPLSALQLVSRFRAASSPAAGRLATHLAAAPLNLPVMQLVQRTMLPDSGPSELAEILLSGLLTRSKTAPDTGQWYEFEPGVRQALLGPLGRDEALLVLKHCSEYVEQHFGKGGPNFPALAHAQLDSGSAGRLPADWDEGEGTGPRRAAEDGGPEGDRRAEGDPAAVPQPFAEVAADVLRRFMPVSPLPGGSTAATGPGNPHPATAAAQSLVTEYEEHGMVQSLMDAAQLLRSAVRQRSTPDPVLLAACARTLLRLWRVQGGEALLTEARDTAARAVAAGREPAHRAVLAQVLRAVAEESTRRGDRAAARETLRRAEREYAAACAAPALGPDEALALTLERVAVLEAQWRLARDGELLQSGVGMLEALADARPDGRRPAPLSLAHGRLLLRLSTVAEDEAEIRDHAERAARSLRAALDEDEAARAEGTGALPEGERPAVLLDLLDALLRSGPEAHARAETLLHEALPRANGRRRSELLIRAGRLCAARYRESGAAQELDRAADRFGEALPGVPRDSAAHSQLLFERGSTLLDRARLPDGSFAERLHRVNRAVQVLRGCLTETASTHRAAPRRELLLGRALVTRYRLTEDRVDLREAEHHLGLAARGAREPIAAATCRLEWGQVLVNAAEALRRPAHYDDAADAFRSAAQAARAAQERAATPRRRAEAVSRAAQAHHWRGITYEAAGRPRAARTAYRAAAEEWERLPAGMEALGEPTPADTARRLTELTGPPD
ncbi:SAV_2336 N-terminal domain-related protein [Streptomyces sp. NPDC007088]|uniref:SAV_2336 N-terminal domain-related protein n=1 Tax=Streptomyces sp. NPDC007088 TaxID=3364773 RepID=UPI0036A1C809